MNKKNKDRVHVATASGASARSLADRGPGEAGFAKLLDRQRAGP
jgi:hypothetical protein